MPTPGTHRVLLKQSDGTYTAVESENPPHGIVRTDPHFEKQLSSCLPTPFVISSDSFGVRAVGKIASGGYIIATYGPNPETDITVFDAGSHLIAESTYTDALPSAFADLNGDGIPDLIGTKFTFGHFQVLTVALGTGGAGFAPPTTYMFSGGDVRVGTVVVADLNGDQKPDLVVSNGTPESAKVSVLYNKGDGTFEQEKVLVNSAGILAVADLNGDGKLDLVLGDSDPSTSNPIVEVALAIADGTFAKPVPYSIASGDSVAVGDVNGDGFPDIITNGITILYGDGKGGFRNRRDVVATRGNLIVTDFDGDGIPDIVVGIGNSEIIAGDIVVVLSGVGAGRFAGPEVSLVPNYPDPDSLLTALAAADVNGDGIPDLATVDDFGHVSILTGRGDGTFQSTLLFNVKSGIPWALAFSDFNHDGNLDLAVVASGYTQPSLGEVDILLGNGDGTFQPPLAMSTPLGSFAFGIGDFNGDGKSDLAVLVSKEASGVSDAVLILAGKGDGTFTTGASYPVGPQAHSLAVGDFNGDGKLDIVVTDAGTFEHQNKDGNIALLFGKGDGTFADARIIPFTDGYYGPYGMVAADINGDSRLDLVLTLAGRGLLTILGRGDGTFQPSIFHAIDALTVLAKDLNTDGVLDLIVSGNTGIHYALGEGDGSFGPESAIPDAAGTLALADFNGDGKIDVAGVDVAGIVTVLNTSVPAPALSVVSAASLAPGPIAPDSMRPRSARIFRQPARRYRSWTARAPALPPRLFTPRRLKSTSPFPRASTPGRRLSPFSPRTRERPRNPPASSSLQPRSPCFQ